MIRIDDSYVRGSMLATAPYSFDQRISLPVYKAAYSCTVSHAKLCHAASDLADDAADLMTRNPVGKASVNDAIPCIDGQFV